MTTYKLNLVILLIALLGLAAGLGAQTRRMRLAERDPRGDASLMGFRLQEPLAAQWPRNGQWLTRRLPRGEGLASCRATNRSATPCS